MRNSVLLSLLLLVTSLSHAAPDLVPAPPQLSATAYMLVDQHSGRILAEHNADQRIEPASLVKIMTVYIAFQQLKNGVVRMQDRVRISENARYKYDKPGSSRMFIEVNSLVSFEDLMKGIIVQSGNDACVAVAEHISGSEAEFVRLMNQYATELGMTNSHFTNTNGWPDPDLYTTARDLAILSRALIRDFPELYQMFALREFRHNNILQPNRNKLLWLDERVDGIKTGATESSGYSLIASAVQNDMRLTSIVLGDSSESARATASRKLLNYGFRFYETFALHASNEPLTEMRIWKGEQENVALGLVEPLYVTIPRGQRERIKANMKVDSMIMAPARKGQQYGTVNVMLGEQLLVSKPLVALQDVPEGGFWRKLVDSIALLFN